MSESTPTVPRLVSADALASQLGIPKERLYELARDGRIPHTRIGRTVRFDPTRVAAWLNAGGTASASK